MPSMEPHPWTRPPKFDLRQARAFLCVADELHFGRAAARLFTSQPALSRLVSSLEEDLGVPLLERSTRKVRLTAAGEAFAAECLVGMKHLSHAQAAALDAAEGRTGRLRLAYMDFAINGRLPALLREFRRQQPGVIIDMEYLPSSKQRTALLEGRTDIGFMIGEFESERVANVMIDQDELVALLPDGHPLATQPTLRLKDLADEPFVMGTEDAFSSFRRFVNPICHELGFLPNVVQQASNTSGILGMVASGAGVSLFAGCVRNLQRTGVAVRSLADVQASIPVFAAWVAESPPDVLCRFRDFLIRQARIGRR